MHGFAIDVMIRHLLTIFLSAFLLFLVQPLIGKYILPWFGGGAGVWTTCLLFFQVVLLVGYAYAHGMIRWLSPRFQAIVHIGLLLAALAFLPIIPSPAWKPQGGAENPTWRILMLLTLCLGPPYVMLSATGPLLQAWFSRTHAGRSPYRLYALSNIGSLLALMAYPFVVEPMIGRTTQAIGWSCGFAGFVLICGYCAVRSQAMGPGSSVLGQADAVATPSGQALAEPNAADQKSKHAQPDRSRHSYKTVAPANAPRSAAMDRALWILLPACASMLLLAVTTHLSDEIAPVPFLWVLPLSIYLLSFIISFEWPRMYFRPVYIVAIVVAPWLVLLMLLRQQIGIREQVAVYALVLFACCMVCHGELYRLRPRPEKLTAYYLAIAAGGALGGAFVSIAAPLLFSRYVELYIGLYGSIALLLACMLHDRPPILQRGEYRLGLVMIIAIVLLAGFMIRMRLGVIERDLTVRARNFYGTLAVRVNNSELFDAPYRQLEHGRIKHGAQVWSRAIDLRRLAVTYYGPHSGVSLAVHAFPAGHRRIGVVGLGAGTVATYGEAGDAFSFYEINPQVVRFANDYFTYLADARDRKVNINIMMGDARLTLEQQEPQKFDVLMLDAFSGDAIPIHLLTREAFGIYQRHLAEGGVIAVNVTNRYLDLHPMVHKMGDAMGFSTVIVDSPPDEDNLITEAHWVLLTRNQALLQQPEIKADGVRPGQPARVRLWTDDHASLLDALR